MVLVSAQINSQNKYLVLDTLLQIKNFSPGILDFDWPVMAFLCHGHYHRGSISSLI